MEILFDSHSFRNSVPFTRPRDLAILIEKKDIRRLFLRGGGRVSRHVIE